MQKSKVFSGILLVVLGVVGLFYKGKRKYIVLPLSVLSIVFGVWLTVLGLEDRAVGTIGRYEISKGGVQTVYVKDYDTFHDNVLGMMKQKGLRRHRFGAECGFTVYRIGDMIFNLPKEDYVCDGQVVVDYEP